jgi:thioredoxin reductase
MPGEFMIAIVGGGPAGISAAVHAARHGISHVLLERRARLFGTVHSYPKAKLVMAAPEDAPILSDLPFEAGPRETVLDSWANAVKTSGINVRLTAEVVGITGQKGEFILTLADGGTVKAEYVVLAIGVRGTLSRLRIPGADDNSRIQYEIQDPEEISGERVVVVGRGDSAIEDALALSSGNEVAIVHRGEGFERANPSNARRLQEAIRSGRIRAYANVELKAIDGRQLVFAQGA